MRYKEDFINYLRFEKRFSHHTILSYENDLNQFYDFLHLEGILDEIPDHRNIRSWVIGLLEKGNSPRTVHRKLSSLRSYCKFLMNGDLIKYNPVDKVLKPKLTNSLPEFLDEDSINNFLDTHNFGEGYTGIRNRLIIELLYQTGMRRAEIVSLRVNSVQSEEGQILVDGKRSKQRLIPLSRSALQFVNDYLKTREANFPASQDNHLFLTQKGKPVYDKLIYRIVQEHLSYCTTRKKKSPHVLRHTFATHLLNKGADLNAIKELLGHANLSATQVYTHTQFENLKNTYKKAHPRAD